MRNLQLSLVTTLGYVGQDYVGMNVLDKDYTGVNILGQDYTGIRKTHKK